MMAAFQYKVLTDNWGIVPSDLPVPPRGHSVQIPMAIPANDAAAPLWIPNVNLPPQRTEGRQTGQAATEVIPCPPPSSLTPASTTRVGPTLLWKMVNIHGNSDARGSLLQWTENNTEPSGTAQSHCHSVKNTSGGAVCPWNTVGAFRRRRSHVVFPVEDLRHSKVTL